MNIRRARVEDMTEIQHCNLVCTPMNYEFNFFLYHVVSWPLSFVAETEKGRIVGYILSKLDEDINGELYGNITSLAVHRSYRRLGIARSLMDQTAKVMVEMYSARVMQLHVNPTNRAAYHLYNDVLDFELIAVEKDYYDEGEHAYCMRRSLVKFAKDNQIKPFDEEMFYSEKKFVKKVENQEDDVDL